MTFLSFNNGQQQVQNLNRERYLTKIIPKRCPVTQEILFQVSMQMFESNDLNSYLQVLNIIV